MALDATATVEEVKLAYAGNAAYEERNDVAMAARFVTACRRLAVLMPKSASKDRTSLSLSPEILMEQMNDARLWLASKSGGAFENRHLSIQDLRDVAGGGQGAITGGV